MKSLIAIGFLFALTTQADSAPKPKAKHVVAKTQTAAASVTTTGSSKRTASKGSRTTVGKGKSRYAKRRSAPGPSFQAHPEPQRYQEIQTALATQGFYHGEPNGQWDANSTDALKSFQAQHGIEPDGKINSRSLISLGLGPKHDSSAKVPLSTVESPADVPTATEQVGNAPDTQ